ncbi:type I restriction-modification system subunit M [Brevundimonas naejangsanensis]|uniref:type I restriction-modification system subunit M n=1 Tax=Brevundimonas naejangsanensis TaxID=588932 RepID=UPI0004738639|nr:class I SAM-dependent DNA methyltransferase [Brevundimonas naejangsanensis]
MAGGNDLGFEAELFKAADKLRGNLEPSEYKHVALGLIFLKYISEAFEAQRAKLEAEPYADPEDPEEYLADHVFWVPAEARWSNLQANAKRPEITFTDVTTGKERRGDIGNLIDNAMEAIERANVKVLKDVLPKDYGRPQLDKRMVGELVDLFSNVNLKGEDGEARDLLGRAYEYFISQFAGAEGRRGGEFFTPRSVVRTIVEMLEPTKGRVYDPACGSGGMFVQSETFVEAHQGKRSDIAIYGQERILQAAGLKSPDISILSDEFLLEVAGMEKKNLALEALKKLLAGEIKSRARTNVVETRAPGGRGSPPQPHRRRP